LTYPADSSSKDTVNGSPIAGSVLPIRSAEELLQTLTGVISAKIAVESGGGAIEAIHLLTSEGTAPKQTVRNVESALMAHFGMRIDHRKISVATTQDSARAAVRASGAVAMPQVPLEVEGTPKRRWYFEDVEVRRSRAKGVTCRVTLRKGDASYVGEAEGAEHDRAWIELAAQATMSAISKADPDSALALYGVKMMEAFEREFVFVGVTARIGRESVLLTGTCEIRDNAETSSALAVLDATNRWLAHVR
jgi:hypothetical protein